MTKEHRFYQVLGNLFVGVPVEGKSGYINLMRIKARYFEQVMKPCLQKEIGEALQPFPDFREELFDKLYTFFKRYFTESGSIGFFFTPYHQSIYERVYTDDQDVILFWKTARLYYVKTDRLFRRMQVEVDGFRFVFDVSNLEHKKANEKRELVFDFKERRDGGALVFAVSYSERGRATNITEIRRKIRDSLGLSHYTDAVPSEETLEKAFRLFERQSEVDYFLCKDARSFLREQFDLWLWQYLLGKPGEEPETQWTEQRIKQLQALKRIAYRVIDFIAAFEDELVRIWNKPKFILRSGYVITLDRIMEVGAQCAVPLLERLIAHPGFAEQVKEWQELGMVDESFTADALWDTNLIEGKHLHPRYRFLPIDTRYFKDLELQILALFDNLDEALDGWLIKSENYQALNTMLPKFRERLDFVYIDPPYNTQYSEIAYLNRYKHASWISLIENRLVVSKNWLSPRAIYSISIDDVENSKLSELLDTVFDDWSKNFVTVVHNQRGQQGKNFSVVHEYLYFLYRNDEEKYISDRPREDIDFRNLRDSGTESFRKDAANCFYPILVKDDKIIGFGEVPPDDYHPSAANEEIDGIIYVWPIDSEGKERKWRYARQSIEKVADRLAAVKTASGIQIYLSKDLQMARTVWYGSQFDASEYGTKALQNILGKHLAEEFKYPKSIHLMEEILRHSEIINKGKGIILDFFAGSGTTAHAVINLNREDGGRRKYILVEMADYFYTVLLPRIKKVVFSDKWRDGRAQPDGQGISHFVKYYELEQYEDTLRRTRYLDDEDDDLFTPPETEDPCHYIFLRDPKMLDNAETGEPVVEVDTENNVVRVDLSELYPDIDLAETLSNLTGKWIKRILPDSEDPTRPGTVEFADGTTADLKNPDWRLIKPLIWW
ncbi:hypothetical protein HRbin15_01328 [bacterium HR15]|nr:hypothetical protein HRbin15_01328 [bacterium HR15]